ncbi:BrnA antitoxin family protein [Bdellovibrionales bacterium]|nr:BrnA antitoxin family protein [Bdellovibrionales bacterium]
MRKEYDFSKGKRGAYNSRVKKQITIKIDEGTIEYFKALAEESGISYQNLINLYLRECALSEKKPAVKWQKTGA